jgi:hypothetical protein
MIPVGRTQAGIAAGQDEILDRGLAVKKTVEFNGSKGEGRQSVDLGDPRANPGVFVNSTGNQQSRECEVSRASPGPCLGAPVSRSRWPTMSNIWRPHLRVIRFPKSAS